MYISKKFLSQLSEVSVRNTKKVIGCGIVVDFIPTKPKGYEFLICRRANIANREDKSSSRQSWDNEGAKIWEVPGGTVKNSESTVEGVRREVFEETGMYVSVGDYVGSFMQNNLEIAFYICHPIKKIIKLSEEHDMYQWIRNLKDVKDLVTPKTFTMLQKAKKMLLDKRKKLSDEFKRNKSKMTVVDKAPKLKRLDYYP